MLAVYVCLWEEHKEPEVAKSVLAVFIVSSQAS